MREFHILNLGAGVQSTTLELMFQEGLVLLPTGEPVVLDASIFADTQDEPVAVYEHLAWLKARPKAKILTPSKGRISDGLLTGQNSTGQKMISIPAYTLEEGSDKEGRTRRQCSKEYKIEVIERCIREEIIGVKRGQRVPKDVLVHQYIGISLDEGGRALRIQANQRHKWVKVHFPLIQQFFYTRPLCKQFLAARVPHEVPRSACVYCPFHDDNEWIAIKAVPKDWALAVKVDDGLRTTGAVGNRRMNSPMYVHRSCKPIKEIEFIPRDDPRAKQLPMNFNQECMGVCGV